MKKTTNSELTKKLCLLMSFGTLTAIHFATTATPVQAATAPAATTTSDTTTPPITPVTPAAETPAVSTPTASDTASSSSDTADVKVPASAPAASATLSTPTSTETTPATTPSKGGSSITTTATIGPTTPGTATGPTPAVTPSGTETTPAATPSGSETTPATTPSKGGSSITTTATIGPTTPGTATGSTPAVTPSGTETTPVATPSGSETTPATTPSKGGSSITTTVTIGPNTPPATPSDVVTFTDPAVAAAVQKTLKLGTAPVTVTAIKDYKGGSTFEVDINQGNTAVNSFSGIQALQNLPSDTLVQLFANINITGHSFDFSPLKNLNFAMLGLDGPNLGNLDNNSLQQLMEIDPEYMSNIEMVGSNSDDAIANSQKNTNGLTNSQLVTLGPWLTKIGNNGQNYPINEINLSDNQLSDFSPLSGLNQKIWLLVVGESVTNPKPVYGVVGQPLSFTGDELIGPNGKNIDTKYAYSLNGDPENKMTPLTETSPNQYTITTAYPNNTTNDLAYAQTGYVNGNGDPSKYIDVSDANGVELKYDAMVRRPVVWQAHPQITVNYLDRQTNQPIQTAVALGAATKIGDAFNLTDTTKIKDYQFVPGASSATTGTYQQTPQTLNLYFSKIEAAPTEPTTPTTSTTPTVKPTQPVFIENRPTAPDTATPAAVAAKSGLVIVQYRDLDNQIIAPDRVLTASIGTAYRTVPKIIAGYTLVGYRGSMEGVYSRLPKEITYLYKKIAATEKPIKAVGQIEVQYVDPNGKALAPKLTLTGTMGTHYQTQIKALPGYSLTTTPTNHSGTFSAKAQNVVYVYEPLTTASQAKTTGKTPTAAKPSQMVALKAKSATTLTTTTALKLTKATMVPLESTSQPAMKAHTHYYRNLHRAYQHASFPHTGERTQRFLSWLGADLLVAAFLGLMIFGRKNGLGKNKGANKRH
ncbi:MucBP domain-containing protein [Agrilactobacillus yilanensis]|uniref:MucBP domain-containing protein n=1 Tax=Agrilactobacillus yilanensis TaxID=2485997 RepID=A0ABW4J7U7_9LACO